MSVEVMESVPAATLRVPARRPMGAWARFVDVTESVLYYGILGIGVSVPIIAGVYALLYL